MTTPAATTSEVRDRYLVRKVRVVAAVAAAVLICVAVAMQVSPAQAGSVTAIASADTYTRADAPTSNFGQNVRLSSDGRTSVRRHGFLRFNVSVPSGQHVVGATLRAYSKSASTGAGVDAYVTGTGWTETGVTWNTEPARAAFLSKASRYSTGPWVSWAVGAAVPGGQVNLRLESTEAAWLGFDSRESTCSTRAPQLVVTTAVIGTSTTRVPTKAMHWVLQTETSTDAGVVPTDATAGHVQVDWAVAYKPATSPSPTPTTSDSPSPSPAPPQTGGDITIAAVGDINGSEVSPTTGASGLNATSIKNANPDVVATLGDHQYALRVMLDARQPVGQDGLGRADTEDHRYCRTYSRLVQRNGYR